MKRPKIGDIIEITLSSGEKVYGQYIIESKFGPIIQVYEEKKYNPENIDNLVNSRLLFPPVIVGLFAAIKNQLWRIVDNRKVIIHGHPKFVSTIWNEKTGEAGIWSIWDGERFTGIGANLPTQYKDLEFLIIWPPQMIVERIETGKMPFPYYDLIQHNRFTPIK